MADPNDLPSNNEKLSAYKQLLDSFGLPIFFLDGRGRILTCNQPANLAYKKKEEDLVDKGINEVIVTPPVMEWIARNNEKLEQEEGCSGDFFVNLGAENYTWVTIRVSRVRMGTQELYCLILLPPGMLALEQISGLNKLLTKIDKLFEVGDSNTDKLTELAQMLIPELADLCCIHPMEADGTIGKAILAPAEAMNNQAVYEWLQNDLLNDEVDGLPAVIQSGQSKIIALVSPVRRVSEAGIKSYMIIPLKNQRQMLGTITLIMVNSDRYFDAKSLKLVENLVLHITPHLEQARLHLEREQLEAELEQRVGEKSAVLQETTSQLKQTEEMIQTLFRISNKLNATLEVESILDALAQEAIEMVNGESGFAGLRTPEGMTVHKYFHEGVAIPFEHTWVLGEGIPGWVLKYKVPYGTSDAENDPLIRHDLVINADVHSIICTPILDTVGEVIAYFDIRNKKGEEGFSINDQEMLLTLAPVASIAIQNALTYQQRLVTVNELKESSKQLQELAVSLETAREEERMQISRELHDELGQSLTAMKYDLAWLSARLGEKDEVLVQKAKDITSQINKLIKTVRRLTTELRPGMLDDLGLVASLEWQARDFEKRTGIRCKLDLPKEELSLSNDQSLALFRIFQEALTNVARYAGAKMVEVSLEKHADLITLVLRDNGRGIKDEEIGGLHSLGLLGMRERAEYLGGSFEVKGVPDQGTTLQVTIPIGSG